jgi:alkylhydroperoxidase family enzyme
MSHKDLFATRLRARRETHAPAARFVAAIARPAVLRFTDLLTSYPGNIDPSDLDALGSHFTEEQIVELVLVIATANWTNRVNDGLQTPLS